MLDTPRIAGRAPVRVTLEAGRNYAFCTCGLSATQPFCDGAHKPTRFRPIKFNAQVTEEMWMCLCKQSGNAPRCDGTHYTLPAE